MHPLRRQLRTRCANSLLTAQQTVPHADGFLRSPRVRTSTKLNMRSFVLETSRCQDPNRFLRNIEFVQRQVMLLLESRTSWSPTDQKVLAPLETYVCCHLRRLSVRRLRVSTKTYKSNDLLPKMRRRLRPKSQGNRRESHAVQPPRVSRPLTAVPLAVSPRSDSHPELASDVCIGSPPKGGKSSSRN